MQRRTAHLLGALGPKRAQVQEVRRFCLRQRLWNLASRHHGISTYPQNTVVLKSISEGVGDLHESHSSAYSVCLAESCQLAKFLLTQEQPLPWRVNDKEALEWAAAILTLASDSSWTPPPSGRCWARSVQSKEEAIRLTLMSFYPKPSFHHWLGERSRRPLSSGDNPKPSVCNTR